MNNIFKYIKLVALTGLFLMFFLKFSLIPYFIVLLVLSSLFTINYKQIRISRLKMLIPILLLFLVNLFSLIYSSNLKFGLQTIETQISLIIFPFLISLDKEFYYNERIQIKSLYIYSSYLSVVAFIVFFLYYGKLEETIEISKSYDLYSVLRYLKLSAGQHPSYISLGYLFSVIMIWQNLKFAKKRFAFFGTIILIAFLLIFVFFLNSRAVFIASLLVLIYYAIKYMREHKLIHKLIVISVLIIGFVFFLNNTRFKKVFQNFENASSIEQIDLRFSLWRDALIAWKQNPILGQGIGDSKAAIMYVHKQRNIEEAVEYNYNAHNQFLETLVQTGILGFFVLLSVFFIPLYRSIIKRQELIFLFLIITATCFVFESMLQRLTGVVFFSFWYSFLVLIYYRPEENHQVAN